MRRFTSDTTAQVGKTLVHLTLDFWVAVLCLVVWLVGLSLTLGLGITIIGGAIALAATLFVSTQIARFERARSATFLDTEISTPPLHPIGTPTPQFGIIGRYISSRTAWRALTYVIWKSITGLVFFGVAISVFSVGIAMMMLPWARFLFPKNGASLLGLRMNSNGRAIAAALVGAATTFIIAPTITLMLGKVNRSMAASLLGPTRENELQRQVVEVSARRTAAVEGAEAERRRIERDLHDGAQQRLVALGMTIGLAKEKLDSDPDAVRELLNEAHTEAKSAMTELRSIARGIHPAILDDRGLDAALSSIAARAPIPVTIHVDLPQRIGPTLEGTAYYVVSEALTNIAKHANATQAFVNVDRIQHRVQHRIEHRIESAASDGAGETVIVTVTDNGCGGARLIADGGLAGLRDRVVGVGGKFELTSPIGGPTTLTAEFPR